MKREIQQTKDGSFTLYLPEWDEHFHSHNGAVQESLHIFIGLGLNYVAPQKKKISILEMGFGSGLNALLTWDYAKQNGCAIDYVGIELYPITKDEFDKLQYAIPNVDDSKHISKKIFQSDWQSIVTIDTDFRLEKRQLNMLDFIPEKETIDLIYMDAFNPDLQPELWSIEQFQIMYDALRKGGVLTTYSVKGWVKRNLKAVGFNIEKHPGPPGKREVLRAIKP